MKIREKWGNIFCRIEFFLTEHSVEHSLYIFHMNSLQFVDYFSFNFHLLCSVYIHISTVNKYFIVYLSSLRSLFLSLSSSKHFPFDPLLPSSVLTKFVGHRVTTPVVVFLQSVSDDVAVVLYNLFRNQVNNLQVILYPYSIMSSLLSIVDKLSITSTGTCGTVLHIAHKNQFRNRRSLSTIVN